MRCIGLPAIAAIEAAKLVPVFERRCLEAAGKTKAGVKCPLSQAFQRQNVCNF
jgi:hypothetical protein